MVPTPPYSLKAVFLKHLPLWEWCVECIFQGQEVGEEPPIAQGQLEGKPVVMASWLPPPTEARIHIRGPAPLRPPCSEEAQDRLTDSPAGQRDTQKPTCLQLLQPPQPRHQICAKKPSDDSILSQHLTAAEWDTTQEPPSEPFNLQILRTSTAWPSTYW